VLDLYKTDRWTRFWLYSLLFLLLVFIAGTRSGDPDYGAYRMVFQLSPDWNTSSDVILNIPGVRMEPGYLFLNSLVKTVGGNPPAVFLVVAFCSVLLSFIFFRRGTKYIFLAVLVYFSHVFLLREMIQIRSGLAVAISMFTIPYIYKRKLFKTMLILAIAASFHFIASVFLLLYFCYPLLRKSNAQLFVVLLGMTIGSALNLNFFIYLQTAFNSPLLYTYVVDSTYNQALGLYNPVLIKHLLVFAFLFYNRTFFKKEIKYYDVFIASYVIAIFWLSAFNSFSIFAGRIATLFSNVEHILIPSMLLMKKYRYIVFFFILAYSLFVFATKLNSLQSLTFFFLQP